MLVYIWCWAVYFSCRLTLASDLKEPIENSKYSKSDSETIFADVIKNISRVNNVLQELITNYEHLQKLYKSQEEIGSDYGSKTETDEKAVHKIKENEKIVKSNTDNPNKFQSATEMIWSDEKKDNDDDDNDDYDDDDGDSNNPSESNKNEIFKKKEPENENGQMSEKIKKKTQPITKNNDSGSDEKTIEKNESIETNEEPIKAESSKETGIIFVDTHKKRLQKLGTSFKPTTILPYSQFPESATKKINTRYVVKESSYPKKYRDDDIDPNKFLRQGNDTKHGAIKNIVYAEKFSSDNIWHEIINNKTIHLRKEKVLTYDNINRLINASNVSFRNNNVKNALVIATDNNKMEKEHNKSKSDISDEEETNKEMFKANILRQAYSDACFKVVVRKCYKACRAVSKRECARYKCNGRLKSLFKENAKTGCIKYFKPNVTQDNNAQPKKRISYRGEKVISGEGAEGYEDMTRGGYLAACWPHLSQPPKPKATALRNNTTTSQNISNPDKQVNILRDKYEKACQMISREKCVSACNYAYTTSCAGNNCAERMKRAFEKDCRSKCKLAYISTDKSEEASLSSESSQSSGSSSR